MLENYKSSFRLQENNYNLFQTFKSKFFKKKSRWKKYRVITVCKERQRKVIKLGYLIYKKLFYFPSGIYLSYQFLPLMLNNFFLSGYHTRGKKLRMLLFFLSLDSKFNSHFFFLLWKIFHINNLHTRLLDVINFTQQYLKNKNG